MPRAAAERCSPLPGQSTHGARNEGAERAIAPDPVVARYRQAGRDYARPFGALADAYDFLRRGVDDGNLEVRGIESEGGTVIVSRSAFEELERLDEVQRDGWLAVLSRGAGGTGEAISPRAPRG